MSVEELQARIAKLSAEIQTQKEVLRRLEESKWAAQRELHAIRVPIAALPLELSSEIFLQCLPTSPSTCEPSEAPMLLMNVCRAWTEVALATPELWAAIDLRHSKVDVLQTWLHRARHCLLSITLHKRLNADASAVFGHHALQLKHLTLCEPGSYVHLSPSFPRLETLTLGCHKSLATSQRMNHSNGWRLGDVARLLALTPNLVQGTFTFANLGGLDSDSDSDLPTLILPNLRSLEFGTTGSDLLTCLTLPALETLCMSLEPRSFTHFSRFMQRSIPPLRKLVSNGGQFTQLEQYLRLLPSLTHFEWAVPYGIVNELFTTLADWESFLPNLRSLRLISCSSTQNSLLYPTVLRMLSVRHPRLVRFHFFGKQPKPDAESLAGFQRLVAEGMEVVIGEQKLDRQLMKLVTTHYISS